MAINTKRKVFLAAALLMSVITLLYCVTPSSEPQKFQDVVIVGGGMVGGIEAYYAHLDAKRHKIPLRITIYEKNASIADTTISNIVPSLTCDEILSVVPRGQELVKKLEIPFNQPGGIRVGDVAGIHGSPVAEYFKQEVQVYSLNEDGHNRRTQALLSLGKMSMDLWQDMYNNADSDMKQILESSNFNRCGEPSRNSKVLHDGYRIDIIYNIPNAKARAEGMKRDYEGLGYKHCALLSPAEVASIDPFLADFCAAHSVQNTWKDDSVALWRPGGCFDAQVFLPKLYEYLKKQMGDNFRIHYSEKVTGVVYADAAEKKAISGLEFEDGKTILRDSASCQYVFCPGEAVGTLKNLGFSEPAYAGFAGVSLLLNIDIPQDKIKDYKKFSHCMEVHQEGIVLAWQARFRDNKIFIGVAGTKSFYSDQRPTKNQEFARNRNLVQLNMINDVLPEFISLALKYDTKGKALTEKDLNSLESQGIAKRWAGVRSVVYDGFPTVGCLYVDGDKVENARCTTHLGSGGGSFGPAATVISRRAMSNQVDDFTKSILDFGNSGRTAAAAA